jgi:predicted transcriptional regulator
MEYKRCSTTLRPTWKQPNGENNMKANFRTIGIKSLDECLSDAAACMESIERGEKATKTSAYYFSSFEAFRKAMTPQRFALLKVIREKQPESIQSLAKITGRDIKNISEDLKALSGMDLVSMEKHGRSKAPRLKYGGIRLEVAV